jgi:hypothetical protein
MGEKSAGNQRAHLGGDFVECLRKGDLLEAVFRSLQRVPDALRVRVHGDQFATAQAGEAAGERV